MRCYCLEEASKRLLRRSRKFRFSWSRRSAGSLQSSCCPTSSTPLHRIRCRVLRQPFIHSALNRRFGFRWVGNVGVREIEVEIHVTATEPTVQRHDGLGSALAHADDRRLREDAALAVPTHRRHAANRTTHLVSTARRVDAEDGTVACLDVLQPRCNVGDRIENVAARSGHMVSGERCRNKLHKTTRVLTAPCVRVGVILGVRITARLKLNPSRNRRTPISRRVRHVFRSTNPLPDIPWTVEEATEETANRRSGSFDRILNPLRNRALGEVECTRHQLLCSTANNITDEPAAADLPDRKSTRLNSSHVRIS